MITNSEAVIAVALAFLSGAVIGGAAALIWVWRKETANCRRLRKYYIRKKENKAGKRSFEEEILSPLAQAEERWVINHADECRGCLDWLAKEGWKELAPRLERAGIIKRG